MTDRKRIVVLDGYTLGAGDVPWDPVAALGDLVVHDRTAPGELLERAAGAEILLTNKVPLAAATFAQLPRLRFVSVLATGFNIVDLAAADARGIPVSNVPEYSTDSVAQFVLAMVLHFCHDVAGHSADVHRGGWKSANDFCYTLSPQMELAGKTMGLVGFGRIARRVAALAQAFGMKVVAWNRSGPQPSPVPVEFVSLEEVLGRADFVSVHIPQSADNAGLFNAAMFARMKPSARFINTARGGLVVEADLAAALRKGVIAGAAVDVVSREPMAEDNPLAGAPNLLITPHIAWTTLEARRRLMQVTADNVRAFLAGNPINVVNRK